MKLTNLALATAACYGLFATGAYAQGLRQPGSVQPAALSYNYYSQESATPSPSDLEPASIDADWISDAKDGKGSCDDSCGKGGKGSCDPCEPWRLFPEFGNGWTLTGHIAAGGTYNSSDPVSHYNGPVTFNDLDQFQANQGYLSFGRDVDTGGCGWDWGGRVDVLYGSDYIFTQAAGLEQDPNFDRNWNSHRDYGVALPQAYADVAYNNLTLRLGHFYTIMGYEVVPATGNFFYSHAYTMQYGEPFTHTGGLATWQVGDRVKLMGGVVNGWDKFDAVSDRMAFLGGVTFTPCSERYSATVTFIAGDEDGGAPPFVGTRTGYSFVFNLNVTDNINYVFQQDTFWQEDATDDVIAEWYGVNQYLFYTLNDCWKFGVRAEWFRDDDGVRLFNAPLRESVFNNSPLLAGAPFNLTPDQVAGNYYEIAVGANWTPTANLTVRPELRWDWSDDTVVAPFDDLTKDSQFLAAIDAILIF